MPLPSFVAVWIARKRKGNETVVEKIRKYFDFKGIVRKFIIQGVSTRSARKIIFHVWRFQDISPIVKVSIEFGQGRTFNKFLGVPEVARRTFSVCDVFF